MRQKGVSSNGGKRLKLPCCAEFTSQPKMQALNDAGVELLVGLDGRSLTGDL